MPKVLSLFVYSFLILTFSLMLGCKEEKQLPENVRQFLEIFLDEDIFIGFKLTAMDSLRAYLDKYPVDKYSEIQLAIEKMVEHPDCYVRVAARQRLGQIPKKVTSRVFYSDTTFVTVKEMSISYKGEDRTLVVGPNTFIELALPVNWAGFLGSTGRWGEFSSNRIDFDLDLDLADLKSIEYFWERVPEDTNMVRLATSILTLKDGTQILGDDFVPGCLCFGDLLCEANYQGTKVLKQGAKEPFREPVRYKRAVSIIEKRLLKIEILRPSQ